MTGDPTTPERPFPPRRPFVPRETGPSELVELPVAHPQDDQAPPVPEQEERA